MTTADGSRFVMLTCQRGAEAAVKAEIARLWPDWRFSFSRPGFLTFKLPEGLLIAEDFELGAVFARAYGFSLGRAEGATELVSRAIELAGAWPVEVIHCWQRDLATTGYRGYEPGPGEPAADLARQIAAARGLSPEAIGLAQPGQRVLDCVLVEPDQAWIGYHRAYGWATRRPGGFFDEPLPAHAVSRAYLKMSEALAFAELPVQPGQVAAEIGCAPGGSSQALLDRGLQVLGIDPAQVHPQVLADPRFTWLRRRGHEVRIKELRKVRWLAADLNVAPAYTLDTVERIVTHDETDVRGLLLTLKLPEWELAGEVPGYLNRIRDWGFQQVRGRQLHHNRQEICVVASSPARRSH